CPGCRPSPERSCPRTASCHSWTLVWSGVLEGLEQVPGEEVQLSEVCRHRVQEHVLHAGLYSLLDPVLNLVDGPGEVDRLDVLPGPFVGDHTEHVMLLLGQSVVVPFLLGEPAEVLVRDDEPLARPRRALPLELRVDLREVERELVWRRGRASDPAVPPADSVKDVWIHPVLIGGGLVSVLAASCHPDWRHLAERLDGHVLQPVVPPVERL